MKMKFVKIIFPAFLMLAMVTACGAGNSKTGDKSDKEKSSAKTYTISLDTDGFLKKVADFKNNPQEWKYLGDKPAIIDFWAEWCSYCRKLSPVLEELAKEYEGQIYIYKVNTDQEREIATAFGIRALPTLLFIPQGEDPQVAQGALPKEELRKIIETVLLNKLQE
jgi:thioredoxin